MIGEPAVDPLIKELADDRDYLRFYAAAALAAIDNRHAYEPLNSALRNKDLAVIAGAYSFFIRRGEQGTEAMLIDALNSYGNWDMAVDYLNCSNRQLKESAEQWLTRRGFVIVERRGLPTGPIWGAH